MSNPETIGENPVVLVERLPVVTEASAEQIKVTTTVQIIRQGLTLNGNAVESAPSGSPVTPANNDRQVEEPVTPVEPQQATPRKKKTAKKAAPKKATTPKAPRKKAAPKEAPVKTPRKKTAKKTEETVEDETREPIVQEVPAFEPQTILVSADTELPVVTIPVEIAPEDAEAMRENEQILITANPLTTSPTSSSEPAMAPTHPTEEHDDSESPAGVPPAAHEHTPAGSAAEENHEAETPVPPAESESETGERATYRTERLAYRDYTPEEMAEWSYPQGLSFSRKTREMARGIHENDDAQTIDTIHHELVQHDTAELSHLLDEFRRCQDAIAQLENNPNQQTHVAFMSVVTRFLDLVEPIATPARMPARPGTAAAASADTLPERSALGERLKCLIAELNDMTSALASASVHTDRQAWLDDQVLIRPPLAEMSASPLFALERQQEVRGLLKRAEQIYGSQGLKYTGAGYEVARGVTRTLTKPASMVTNWLGSFRNRISRALAATGVAATTLFATYEGYQGVQYVRGKMNSAATAPQDPGTPDPDPTAGPAVAPASPEAADQAALEKILQGMTIEVKGDNLHVKFADTGSLEVNETLFVLVGSGTHASARTVNPIGANEYTLKLSAAEKASGTTLSVTLRGKSSVGTENYLVPKDASGQYDYKTITLP